MDIKLGCARCGEELRVKGLTKIIGDVSREYTAHLEAYPCKKCAGEEEADPEDESRLIWFCTRCLHYSRGEDFLTPKTDSLGRTYHVYICPKCNFTFCGPVSREKPRTCGVKIDD